MDKVKKGDLLIEADIDKIKEKGFSIVTPVIVSHSNRIEEIEMSDGFLKRGEDVIMKVKMKKK
jgi:phosphotransferase system IIA component